MNGRYTKGSISQRIGTSLDIKEMDPTHTEKFTTTDKECSGRKIQQAHHTPTKACEGLLCLTHGIAEVEMSMLETIKVIISGQSLLCDDSINVIKLTKDAI